MAQFSITNFGEVQASKIVEQMEATFRDTSASASLALVLTSQPQRNPKPETSQP